MKNAASFLVALITSVFIYISIYLFNIINSAFEPSGLLLNILQGILIIKCVVLIIFIMPSTINLRQTTYGYLLANILIISYHVIINNTLTFPIYIVVFQAIQSVGYLIWQGRIKVSENHTLHIPEKAKLVAERI